MFILYLGVDCVKVLERVGRADDVPNLPVDLALYAGNMKEHVHPRKGIRIKNMSVPMQDSQPLPAVV